MQINSDNFMVMGSLFNILEFLGTNVYMAAWVIHMVMAESRYFPISYIINYVEKLKDG